MITVEEREAIRRAYYLDKKSKRQIAREQGHSRKTIDKAVENTPPQPYRLTKAKDAPVFGPFQARADDLLAENDHLPPKQQYSAHKIYEILQSEGYLGSESRVRLHVTQWNKSGHPRPRSFCLSLLNLVKMHRWIGEKPWPPLPGCDKRYRCLSCTCVIADADM